MTALLAAFLAPAASSSNEVAFVADNVEPRLGGVVYIRAGSDMVIGNLTMGVVEWTTILSDDGGAYVVAVRS